MFRLYRHVLHQCPIDSVRDAVGYFDAKCDPHHFSPQRRFFGAQQRDLGAVNGYIEEMMHGQKVKIFNVEKIVMEEFDALNDQLQRKCH